MTSLRETQRMSVCSEYRPGRTERRRPWSDVIQHAKIGLLLLLYKAMHSKISAWKMREKSFCNRYLKTFVPLVMSSS